MATGPAPLPLVAVSDTRCPGRVEVDSAEQHVAAATIKEWLTHLRSHGWTEKELGVVWQGRSRQGVTR
jgi:hypothetical protein